MRLFCVLSGVSGGGALLTNFIPLAEVFRV